MLCGKWNEILNSAYCIRISFSLLLSLFCKGFVFYLCLMYLCTRYSNMVGVISEAGTPTLSEISLILWVRVWFSVSCFVDICLYFCPLAITLPTLLRITPLLSSKYSGCNSTFIVCSFAHVHSNDKSVHLTFKSFVYSPLDNIHTSHSKRTA